MSVEAFSAAIQAGDFPSAELLAAALTDDTSPAIPYHFFQIAYDHEQAGRWLNARTWFEQSFSHPRVDDATRDNSAVRLAIVLDQLGDLPGALRYAEIASVSTVEPIACLAWVLRLHYLVREGRWTDILAATEDAAVPDAVAATVYLRRVQARAHAGIWESYERVTAVHLPDVHAAAACGDAAYALECRGFHDGATALYRLGLEAPQPPPGLRTNCHYRLGVIADSTYCWEVAERHLKAAIDCDDPFPAAKAEALYRLAQIRYLSESFADALPLFRQLLESDPASTPVRAEAALKAGTCLLRLRRYEEAEELLSRCEQQTYGGGTETEVKAALLLAEIAEARKDQARASAWYQRIVDHPSADPLTKTGACARISQLTRK